MVNMEKVKIEVQTREKVNKGAVRKIRREGCVPAIVYGKNLNFPVTVPLAALKALRSIHFSASALLDMAVAGGSKRDDLAVMIKDIQYHPLTEQVIHLDFLKVSLEEKIKVQVPLFFKGEPEAVKEGAVLELILRELEIEAYPLDIPGRIEVDVSQLIVGHSLHVSDIQVAPNIKLITHAEDTVVTLLAKIEEEEPVPSEGEVPLPEGPEVIKEKKDKEPEEEGEAGEKKEKKEEKKEKKEKEKE